MAYAQALFPPVHQREHAIVRSNEIVHFRSGDNRPASAPHSRVDHDEVYGACREIRIRLRQRQGAIQDVKSLHAVAYVYDISVGNNVQDHALQRAHKMVIQTEVGSQRNYRTVRHFQCSGHSPACFEIKGSGMARQGTEVTGITDALGGCFRDEKSKPLPQRTQRKAQSSPWQKNAQFAITALCGVPLCTVACPERAERVERVSSVVALRFISAT